MYFVNDRHVSVETIAEELISFLREAHELERFHEEAFSASTASYRRGEEGILKGIAVHRKRQLHRRERGHDLIQNQSWFIEFPQDGDYPRYGRTSVRVFTLDVRQGIRTWEGSFFSDEEVEDCKDSLCRAIEQIAQLSTKGKDVLRALTGRY